MPGYLREMTATFLTLSDVAARLHKSRRWVQDFLRTHPYYRLAGRTKLFTESDVLRLYEAMPSPCPSSSSRRAKIGARTGRSAGHTSASMWTEAAELIGKPLLCGGSRTSKARSSA